jgi:hypothetical protein
MKLPPMLLHIRVLNDEHDFGLWLPLFLLFLIAAVIVIALSPIILLCLLIMWPSGWGRYLWQSIKLGVTSLWALKGLSVDVQGRNGIFRLTVV